MTAEPTGLKEVEAMEHGMEQPAKEKRSALTWLTQSTQNSLGIYEDAAIIKDNGVKGQLARKCNPFLAAVATVIPFIAAVLATKYVWWPANQFYIKTTFQGEGCLNTSQIEGSGCQTDIQQSFCPTKIKFVPYTRFISAPKLNDSTTFCNGCGNPTSLAFQYCKAVVRDLNLTFTRSDREKFFSPVLLSSDDLTNQVQARIRQLATSYYIIMRDLAGEGAGIVTQELINAENVNLNTTTFEEHLTNGIFHNLDDFWNQYSVFVDPLKDAVNITYTAYVDAASPFFCQVVLKQPVAQATITQGSAYFGAWRPIAMQIASGLFSFFF